MIKPAQIERLAVGAMAVMLLPTGVQATFFPKSFFDDFPLGRHWISQSGDAYNEHLVRDVGGLFLALIIVSGWTLWRRHPVHGVAVAWLTQGIFHLVFHAGHLDGYSTTDQVGLIGSLAIVPLLATVALIAGRSSRADRRSRDS